MKKVKGLLAMALVVTILVGNIGIVAANSLTSVDNSDGGSYTTLNEPNPKRE